TRCRFRKRSCPPVGRCARCSKSSAAPPRSSASRRATGWGTRSSATADRLVAAARRGLLGPTEPWLEARHRAGDERSLVAREFWVLQVAGSNPAAPTTLFEREQAKAMIARIYKPAKTAMQSGTAKTKEWVLDYEPEQPRQIEPLMGWTSSGDMRQQV